MSMARITPAQNPRGWARITRKATAFLVRPAVRNPVYHWPIVNQSALAWKRNVESARPGGEVHDDALLLGRCRTVGLPYRQSRIGGGSSMPLIATLAAIV